MANNELGHNYLQRSRIPAPAAVAVSPEHKIKSEDVSGIGVKKKESSGSITQRATVKFRIVDLCLADALKNDGQISGAIK